MITPSTTRFVSWNFLFWKNRLGGLLWIVLLFAFLSSLSRCALTTYCWKEIDPWSRELPATFCFGLVYDLAVGLTFSIPMGLLMTFLPQRIFATNGSRWMARGILTLFLSLFLFVIVSEWIFWIEFGARFNFIAIDYLVYTHEVIQNIQESYPIPAIIGLIIASSIGITTILIKTSALEAWESSNTPFRPRFQGLIAAILLTIGLLALLNNRQTNLLSNNYNQELAKNSVFSLSAAWFDQGIDYNRFYPLIDRTEAFQTVRRLLKSKNSSYLSETPDDITRLIQNPGPEKKWNVIQITVESLSGSFLGTLGNQEHLTPYLDQLADESLFFTNLRATGSRTIRGMEALTLSVPPTPGQSIVRRKNNEHLFSLGSLFQNKGYDTVFIYGGYGYFDNMNQFFGDNGYRILDRGLVPKEAVTFANAWGACDEDVYRWSLREADAAFAQGKPFHHFVMTTSNHRPYTFPSGKIDLPSGSGRNAAVKYTDYAIRQMIEAAQKKPWFENTIFVIVADHCAGSSGKTDLPLREYHIPMMIYHPQLIPAQKVTKLCSQIDYAPTLLGLMNWTYETRFFGKDILKMEPSEERAFVATYQKLGYEKENRLEVLKPIREHALYRIEPKTLDLTELPKDPVMESECISYYQTANDLFENRKNRR